MQTHEAYSVLIQNAEKRGTGTLYYERGNAYFYILTCAHVVDETDAVQVTLLAENEDGEPKEYETAVSKEQIYYSPIDQTSRISGHLQHSCDIAVLKCNVGNIPLKPTDFSIWQMTQQEKVLWTGYPMGSTNDPVYRKTLHRTVKQGRRQARKTGAVFDGWIEGERSRAQTYVDTIQLQQAIDACNAVLQNTEFQACDVQQKYEIYAVLREAYRLAREYDAYDRVSERMHAEGIRNKREPLIDAVRHFEDFKMEEAEQFIQQARALNPTGSVEKVFEQIIGIYQKNHADERELSIILGSRDQLLVEPKSAEEEALIYQIVGFTLSNKFRNTSRAIRCVNRAYECSGNYIVLETVGETYYLHSLRDAEKEGRIDMLKIDEASLGKARDAFLTVLTAADELYLKVMIRRIGPLVFKCFYFLHDDYRVYRHYRDRMKYFEFPNQEMLRDIQRCYLDVAIRCYPKGAGETVRVQRPDGI